MGTAACEPIAMPIMNGIAETLISRAVVMPIGNIRSAVAVLLMTEGIESEIC